MDQMCFPSDPKEYLNLYAFKDKDEFYTNGDTLIQLFRVEELLEHYFNYKENSKILSYEIFDYAGELAAYVNSRRLQKEDIVSIISSSDGKYVLYFWRH